MQLSAIVLLAVFPAVVAHAAMRSAHPTSLSLLAQSKHLKHALSNATQSEAGNASAATSAADPDAEARELFVRKCVVAVSVTPRALLPVAVAERFCDSTDAIVECKLQLARRMEEVHEQNGDMSMFCVSAYEWFQKKYGMHCPKQCHKLQCVSTCNWLKELHNLEEVGDELDVELKKVSDDNTDLESRQLALKEQTRDVLERNRTVAQKLVDVDRAKTTAQGSEKALAEAQNHSDHAASALASRDDIMKQKRQNMSDTEAKLTALRFKIDKANVGKEGQQNEVERLETNRAEIQSKVDDAEKKLKAGQDEVKVLQKMADEDTWKAGNLSHIIEGGNKSTASFQKDYEKAKAHLADMVAKAKAANAANKSGVPDEVIEEQKDLVKQTKGRVVSSSLKTKKVMHRHHKIQRTIDLAMKKIDALKDTIANITQSADAQRQAAQSVTAEITKQTQLVNQSAADIKSMDDEAVGLDGIVQEIKKALKTQGADNEAEMEVKDERHAALEKANKESKAATDEVRLAESSLEAASKALAESEAQRKAQEAKVASSKAAWSKENAGLLTKVAGHKDAMQKLERRKPEIVKQHSLALWQMAGFF